MAKASRKDSRGRVLRKGETQRKTDGRYVYSYTTSYGKRLVVYATTLEELRAKERQIAQDTAEGINTYVAGKATLNFVFDRYFESKKELRSTTASNYWYMYNRFVRDSFGKLPIGQIKYSDVMQFYRELLFGRKLSLNTVDNIHVLLHPAFQMAVRDRIIRNNPTDGVMTELKKKNKDLHPVKKKALTVDEQLEFIRYTQESPIFYRWGPLFTVLLGTGMRIGEAVGLRWQDIDLNNRMIDVNHSITYYPRREDSNTSEFAVSLPKTAAGKRTIPMFPQVYEAFLEEREYQKETTGFNKTVVDGMSGFIFQGRFGNVMNPTAVNRAIKRIVVTHNREEELNAARQKRKPLILPMFSCHILRHTFCTRLCEVEDNAKFIQVTMGHAGIETTMDIYTDVTEETKKEKLVQLANNLIIC